MAIIAIPIGDKANISPALAAARNDRPTAVIAVAALLAMLLRLKLAAKALSEPAVAIA